MNLIELIRKARQTRVEVDGKTFIVRRPTLRERDELERKVAHRCDMLELFVIGWEGVTGLDIVAAGDGEPVEFSRELFAEWIADKDHLWGPLCDAIINEFNGHAERVQAAKKK